MAVLHRFRNGLIAEKISSALTANAMHNAWQPGRNGKAAISK
jgi:hypothetical protein